jgi:hypothetical protein
MTTIPPREEVECPANAAISIGEALSHLEDVRRMAARAAVASGPETRQRFRALELRIERDLDAIGDSIERAGRPALEYVPGDVRGLALVVQAFLAGARRGEGRRARPGLLGAVPAGRGTRPAGRRTA